MLPLALGFIVLATGLGMLLSALYVRFRDMAPIWEVALQVWFYTSPIMFPISSINSRFGHGLEHLAMINPVAIALALIPAIFLLGWWFFTREAPRVAEEL